MSYIAENWLDILVYAGAVVGAASVIAKVTPSKTDDKYVAFFAKLVQFLSINTVPAGPKDDDNV